MAPRGRILLGSSAGHHLQTWGIDGNRVQRLAERESGEQ
jgi:hypothetical protein